MFSRVFFRMFISLKSNEAQGASSRTRLSRCLRHGTNNGWYAYGSSHDSKDVSVQCMLKIANFVDPNWENGLNHTLDFGDFCIRTSMTQFSSGMPLSSISSNRADSAHGLCVVDGRWVIGWQVRVSSLATLAALFLLIFAPIKIIKAAMWWISKKISGENFIKEVMGLWDAILPYVHAAPGWLSQFWSRSNASVHWMGSVHRRRRSIHNATTEMFLEVRIVPHCIAHSHHSPAHIESQSRILTNPHGSRLIRECLWVQIRTSESVAPAAPFSRWSLEAKAQRLAVGAGDSLHWLIPAMSMSSWCPKWNFLHGLRDLICAHFLAILCYPKCCKLCLIPCCQAQPSSQASLTEKTRALGHWPGWSRWWDMMSELPSSDQKWIGSASGVLLVVRLWCTVDSTSCRDFLFRFAA